MTKCVDCGWQYPSPIYLSTMMVSGSYTKPICGICALEISNRLHNISRTEFAGEMAELMRQKAISWRENNPKYGPSGKK